MVSLNTGNSFPWLETKILLTGLVTLINLYLMKVSIDIQKIGQTLDAMHWVICPYTLYGMGKLLKTQTIEDYPHIIELAKSYNQLLDCQEIKIKLPEYFKIEIK